MLEDKKINLEEAAERDYKTKSNLKEEEIKYYEEKREELGLKSIDRFVKYAPNPSNYMKKKITFAHRDLELIADAMANDKPWAVVSGLNPSGPLHFGHKAVFDELLWMQENGAEVFIPITNDESYVVGKVESIAKSRKNAYDLVIPSIIAMGFDSKKTHIFVDSDYKDIYNVAMDISRKVTLNKIFKVFGIDGLEEGENPGVMFYRGAVQLAQILLPQYEEFGGKKPTIIPVGIDQHPYILLSRDVAEKKGFIPPSELVLKFLNGLDGKGKMSASRLDSTIFLTDEPNLVVNKLKKAYTGGSPSAEYQKEHGGIPEICPVGMLRAYHFEHDNKVNKQCSTGELLCGRCKKDSIEQVVQYLSDHQAKLPEAKKRTDEFILKTPIESIL